MAQRILNGLLVGALSVALAAAGCSKKNNGGDGDGDGHGGMGGDSGDGDTGANGDGEGDGDGEGEGSGGSSTVHPGITGPGVNITIHSVKVNSKGVATVDFSLADDSGKPLDREGALTAGAVAPSFVLSWLAENDDGESLQYTAYTTRLKESDEGSEVQSSTDQGGTYEAVELGRYRYTLATKIDINEERSHLTHTLGMYATRTYQDVRYVDNEFYSWVPDGSTVETELDVVTDTACNSCHTRLEFHGGSRRGVEMCQLCHTETNSINPESGNTIDFQVMIHKIHRGKDLPSVIAGEPYYFIGYMGAREDFSDVAYPWDMRDCSKCHDGSQGDRWITRPAQKPCSSCHDRTYFGEGDAPEGWEKHTAGPRDDSECIVCHGEDSLEPITQSHYTTWSDPNAPDVMAKVLEISNAQPGQQPSVEFEVEVDGQAHDLIAEPFDRIRVRLWGPTSDTKHSFFETIDATTVVCADPMVRPCLEAADDAFIYHASFAVPDDAEGTYTVGLDGRYIPDAESGVRYPFQNPMLDFVVSGEETPRREVVTVERCNSCHEHLGPHGGSYNQINYCLNCHNTTAYAGAPEDLAPGGEADLASLNLKDWIHSLHSSVRYPAPLNDCAQCHVDDSTSLPIVEGALPSTYATAEGVGGASSLPIVTEHSVPPESAACTSCHNDQAAKVHAETNSSASGEACATCHGPNKDRDVGVVHQLEP